MYVRLSLADYNALGFFGVEHATQTEETEIVPMEKLYDSIQNLVKVQSLYFVSITLWYIDAAAQIM